MSEQKEEPKQDEQSNIPEVPQPQQNESVTIDVSQSRQNEQEPPVASSFRSRLNHYKESLLQRPIQYDIISIVFALVILGGGIYGYVVKESTASLVAGVVFAILLGFGTYLEGARKNPYPLLAILIFLGSMFAYRYFVSMKFMSGLFTILSAIMVARNCYLIYLRRQQTITTST